MASAPATKRPKKSAATAGGALALILAAVFAHEGGFVDHPDDPGGATAFGCTEAVVRAEGITTPMRQLTREQCRDIYVRRYVDRPGFRPIVDLAPAVGYEIIDTGINAGPRRPSCWFQQGLNAFNRKGRDYPDVKEDCDIGPVTVGSYRALEAKRGKVKACELMVKYLDGMQLAHYAELGRSARFESFMVGWVDKRIGNAPWQACATGRPM